MGPTSRQARILWSSITALAVGILVALMGLIIWGLGWVANRLSSVLLPLAIAGVLAFILDPLVDHFEMRLRSRVKAIWLVFLLAVLAVGGFSATVVPRLVVEVQSFISQVPGYVARAWERTDQALKHPPSWIPARFIPKLPILNRFSTNDLNAAVQPDTTTNHLAARDALQPTEFPTPPVVAGSSTTNADVVEPTRGAKSAQRESVRINADLTRQIFTWAAQSLPKIGAWMLDQLSRVASVAGFLAGLALVPVYLFYFLLEKRKIAGRWTDFLLIWESQAKEEIIFIIQSINDCLIVFFRGQVLVALCVGTLLAIGFSIIGLDYALLLGAMAGVLGIVPYLGVAMSLIPAVVIAFVQFGDAWHALTVVLIFAVVQALEGLFISPRIIGDRVGLHPLTVIIAVMCGTTLLGGIVGGVLAIPLTATLRAVMFRYVWKTERRKPQPIPATTPT